MVMTSCSLEAKALDEEHDSTEESGLGTDYVSNNSNIFYQEGEFWNTYVKTLKNTANWFKDNNLEWLGVIAGIIIGIPVSIIMALVYTIFEMVAGVIMIVTGLITIFKESFYLIQSAF
jgi:ABC-type microcin C transport system permease subunit YejE